MSTYSEYLNFAKDIAKYAGEIMLKYFSKDNGEKYKGDKTIVTLADTEINSFLINRVKEKYPSHAVDGEEEQFGESNINGYVTLLMGQQCMRDIFLLPCFHLL